MSYPGTIGGAVSISTIANRATSCSRLHHHQQQTQAFRKMANEEQNEATSLYICDELVMAQTRCTTAHSPSRSLFLSDCGDHNSNIVSFDFRLTIAGKKTRACAERSMLSPAVSRHVKWAIGSSYPGVLIRSQITRSDSISCRI